jgi:hypothetical protein
MPAAAAAWLRCGVDGHAGMRRVSFGVDMLERHTDYKFALLAIGSMLPKWTSHALTMSNMVECARTAVKI